MLFSFVPQKSLIHQAPTFLKLAFVLCVSIFLFYGTHADAFSWWFCGSSFIVSTLAYFVAKLFIKDFFKLLFSLFFYSTIIFLFSIIELFPLKIKYDNISQTFLYCLRLCTTILLSNVFFKTTSQGNLIDLFYKIHLPKKLIVFFAVILGFIPKVFSSWNKIQKATKSRTNLSTKKCFAYKSIKLLKTPALKIKFLLEDLIETAETTKKSLENRKLL